VTDVDWRRQIDHSLSELVQLVGNLERRLTALEARVAAQGGELHTLEALDASWVRSQGQREADLDRTDRMIERVHLELQQHLDAHTRSR
jgi:hypothetical protein